MSSITLEKPFPFPGRIAGLRLALFERGVLEREVDIRFYLVRRLPAGHLAGEAALPVCYFRSGLSILVAFHGNRYFTPISNRGCLAIAKLFAR